MTKFTAYHGGIIEVLGVSQIETDEATNELALAMFVRTEQQTNLKMAFEHTAMGRSHTVTDVIPITDDVYLVLLFSSLDTLTE